MDFLASTHLHIFSWVVGIVLFLIASQMKVGTRNRTIFHMSARVFYLFILASGAALFFKFQTLPTNFPMPSQAVYGIKFTLGLLTLGLMEMVLVREKKGKNPKPFWIIWAILVFATIFLGFKLPVGIQF